MRIVSASVAVSNRASNIIRNVLTKGDLGIVEKVCLNIFRFQANPVIFQLDILCLDMFLYKQWKFQFFISVGLSLYLM